MNMICYCPILSRPSKFTSFVCVLEGGILTASLKSSKYTDVHKYHGWSTQSSKFVLVSNSSESVCARVNGCEGISLQLPTLFVGNSQVFGIPIYHN